VTDDPVREYSGLPGRLITVHDPDDSSTVLRLIPETGTTGTGGGAYLVLHPCPGCSTERQPCDVPMISIAGLADLGLYQHEDTSPIPGYVSTGDTSGRGEVPIEFFGDPGHLADCPLR
jgi:hypothetical protein